MNLFRRSNPAPSPIVRNRTVTLRDDSGYSASIRLISDNGQDDPLEFDLTPAEHDEAAFAQAQLRMQRNVTEATRHSDAYRAQLQRWAAIPDTPRTEAELAAIEADQARRIRATGKSNEH